MTTSTAPYKPGQAVFYTPYVGLDKPLILHPARVLHTTPARVRIRLDNGREMSVSAHYVCYRGYCEACQLPAVEDAGQLLCPQCEAPAIAAIPPDRILFDQTGELSIYARAGRDVLAGKIASLSDWHDQQRNDCDYNVFVAMLQRVKLYYSWSTDHEVWTKFRTCRMRDLAILDDEAGFIAEYRRLATEHGVKDAIVEYEKIERACDFVEKLLQLVEDGAFDDFDLDDFDPADLSSLPRRAASRPVLLDLPDAPDRAADDAEPDTADDITRWLDEQFGGNTPAA